MFSKELQLMDQNTVKYMMDELQEELDSTKEQLSAANTTISDLTSENARLHKLLEEKGIEA